MGTVFCPSWTTAMTKYHVSFSHPQPLYFAFRTSLNFFCCPGTRPKTLSDVFIRRETEVKERNASLSVTVS